MGMQQTTADQPLRAFRQAVYQTLGRRKDSLFELLEAALASSSPATMVHLSLATVFRRRWASASDALADVQVRPAQCRAVIHGALAEQAVGERPIWVGDGTSWPRPRAKRQAAPRSASRPLRARPLLGPWSLRV